MSFPHALGLSPASSASTRVESMSPPLRSPSPSPVVSPSASLARSPSRAFSTCPNTIVRHALPKTFTSVSHGTYISISPTSIRPTDSSVSISSALRELCVVEFFRRVLTFLASYKIFCCTELSAARVRLGLLNLKASELRKEGANDSRRPS